MSCDRDHAPGQVLHALQELRSIIDDRLRGELGGRYDRHRVESVGTDKLTVTFTSAQLPPPPATRTGTPRRPGATHARALTRARGRGATLVRCRLASWCC